MAPLVAVVDDEETVCKALERLLRATGLQTLSFASCPLFLAFLEHRCPDCVILDLHMPGMSGLELLRTMQSRGTRVPSIVITAHDEPGTEGRCLRAGAAAYLRKPLDSGVLLDAIAAVLGRPEKKERS